MYYFPWLANIRGEKANVKLRELFEEEKYAEIVQLFVPYPVFKVGNDLVNVWWKVWDIYWIFAILRILLVIFPQPGYIHPDEYFQTVEVITGDVLGSRYVWIFIIWCCTLTFYEINLVFLNHSLHKLEILQHFFNKSFVTVLKVWSKSS